MGSKAALSPTAQQVRKTKVFATQSSHRIGAVGARPGTALRRVKVQEASLLRGASCREVLGAPRPMRILNVINRLGLSFGSRVRYLGFLYSKRLIPIQSTTLITNVIAAGAARPRSPTANRALELPCLALALMRADSRQQQSCTIVAK